MAIPLEHDPISGYYKNINIAIINPEYGAAYVSTYKPQDKLSKQFQQEQRERERRRRQNTR